MKLLLAKTPNVRGIYNGKTPTWSRYLHPKAVLSLKAIENETHLVYTSLWRNVNASLWACRNKQGVMLPGFSAHNYGLAIDVAVEATLARSYFTNYTELNNFMEKHGWWCHRRDGRRGFEDWHFNFLGYQDEGTQWKNYIDSKVPKTWHLGIEAKIKSIYEKDWMLSIADVQRALKKLKFYEGRVDGIWGKISVAALQAFQRAYLLKQTAYPESAEMRVLAFATATKKIE